MLVHRQRGVQLPVVPSRPSVRDWTQYPSVHFMEQADLHAGCLRVGGGEYRSVHVGGERDLLVQVEGFHRWNRSGRRRGESDRRNAKQRHRIRRLGESHRTIANEEFGARFVQKTLGGGHYDRISPQIRLDSIATCSERSGLDAASRWSGIGFSTEAEREGSTDELMWVESSSLCSPLSSGNPEKTLRHS